MLLSQIRNVIRFENWSKFLITAYFYPLAMFEELGKFYLHFTYISRIHELINISNNKRMDTDNIRFAFMPTNRFNTIVLVIYVLFQNFTYNIFKFPFLFYLFLSYFLIFLDLLIPNILSVIR